MTKYWIETTDVKNVIHRNEGDRALGKVLWSPQKDKRGRDRYKNMKEVNPGDIILHLIDKKVFSGISIVSKKAYETSGLVGTRWDGPAYLIELENYIELDPPLGRNELLNDNNKEILFKIKNSSEVFYDKDLNLRQGAYLTPCPKELMYLISKVFKDKTSLNLPHSDKIDIPNSFNEIETPYLAPSVMLQQKFIINQFSSDLKDSGLIYSKQLLTRFVASLLTKPFLILTGLSGSGKTKLAQAFAQWICKDKKQYGIVPVGADWTNREPLLGYPNALELNKYVKPDSGALDLIISAKNKPELPHFLILDEMNLSLVERYFADFLSVMESNDYIPLYPENSNIEGIDAKLYLPSNLFIIGTVNIDETTNMFSPKVLDRANTIEFRVNEREMNYFLNNIKDIEMVELVGKGVSMANNFLELSYNKSFKEENTDEINNTLVKFFRELKKTGAEFGYRTASEIIRLINQLNVVDNNLDTNEKIDIAIIQKLLPKLHGSRRKLAGPLTALGSFCISDDTKIVEGIFDNVDFNFNGSNVLYPLSLEKITRMYKSAFDSGFASFAEA